MVINGDKPRPEENSLFQLEAELERLKARYTDKHPDIQRLKKQIEELRSRTDQTLKDNVQTEDPYIRISPQRRQQISEVQREIIEAEAEITQLTGEISKYQKRVENTPRREQELLSLRRDYDNIKASYESLLARKLEADIAVNMERKQKGEQFRIVDPARLPQKPIKPDSMILILSHTAVGLGLGFLIIFLLEFVSPKFRKPEEIEDQYGLSVLATIPRVLNKRQIYMQRLNRMASYGYFLATLFIIAVAGFIGKEGPDQIVEVINRYIL